MSRISNLPIILVKDQPIEFTYDGEENPSGWLYLSDGTYLEIEHEERLPEGERYFYVRHHCSCSDYRLGLYAEGGGCMFQMTVDTFKEASDMVRNLVAEAEEKDIHIEKLQKIA